MASNNGLLVSKRNLSRTTIPKQAAKQPNDSSCTVNVWDSRSEGKRAISSREPASVNRNTVGICSETMFEERMVLSSF
jgi:hypothetical protein